MERLISCRTLLLFLESNILHPTQHGFLKGRSTCTNLMECMNDWTLSIQYKRLVTVVYIDFSKAFDVVSHDKLLIRLAAYGITGTLLKWSQNFLSNRIHCTRVRSALSSSAELISGVIQGSGIGPLFFLMYINELAQNIGRLRNHYKVISPMIPSCTQRLLILLTLHGYKPPWTAWHSELRHGS